MDKKEAIKKVKAYAALLGGHFDLAGVYLYGSYAREDYKEDSDIDVAIVLQGVVEDFFTVNPLLWKLRRQIDDRIEPIVIEKDHDPLGFLEEIKKYAIEIPVGQAHGKVTGG